MNALVVAGVLLVILGISYQTGWSRSRNLVTTNGVTVHSRPQYHGTFTALWAMLPALAVVLLWAWFGGDITVGIGAVLIVLLLWFLIWIIYLRGESDWDLT